MLNLSGTKRKVFTRDIQWFEAYGNYVKVWLKDEMLLANTTFKQLLDSLPHIDLLNPDRDNTINQSNDGIFAQIHKSYGVNLTQAKALTGDHLVMEDDTQIKIGKTFKKALKQRFCWLLVIVEIEQQFNPLKQKSAWEFILQALFLMLYYWSNCFQY